MKRAIIWTLAITMSLLFLGQATSAERPPDHPLHDAHSRMAQALIQGDPEALASCYALEARLSFPLRPDIVGRDEIKRQAQYVIGLGVQGFHIIEEDLFVGETFVLQSGTCIFYNEGGQEFSRSRFMTVWRRVGDRWLIFRDFVV